MLFYIQFLHKITKLFRKKSERTKVNGRICNVVVKGGIEQKRVIRRNSPQSTYTNNKPNDSEIVPALKGFIG